MATTPSNGDAAAVKSSSSPPNLMTIPRELRQQILVEVFHEHIQTDILECVYFCSGGGKVMKRHLIPTSIIKQEQDLNIALPELKDDIVFVEAKIRESFDEKMGSLPQAVNEVIHADHERDSAGYMGCDTIQFMRLGGVLNSGFTGEENLKGMELWWTESLERYSWSS